MLPVGAVLDDSSRHSVTLEGKVGVYSEGRHYSVSLKDLLTKAEATRPTAVQLTESFLDHFVSPEDRGPVS